MPGRRRSHEEELHREAEEIAIPVGDITGGPVKGVGPMVDGADGTGTPLPVGSAGADEVPPASAPGAEPEPEHD